MSGTKRAWTNLILFAITLLINVMGATGLINGLTQKEVSDMYPTLITPAPVTFSIWGVIYLLLLISLIAMIVIKDEYYQKAIDNITFLFRFSCLLNIAWIISFSYIELGISVVFIFGLVITLALICKKLLMFHENRRFLLPLTFGLYTGWLIIASVVNVSALLVKLNWNGFGISDSIWASIVLLAAAVLVFIILMSLQNAVLPLPIAWAYFGIYISLKSANGYNGEYPTLEIISVMGMVVLIIMAVVQFKKNEYGILPKVYA